MNDTDNKPIYNVDQLARMPSDKLNDLDPQEIVKAILWQYALVHMTKENSTLH